MNAGAGPVSSPGGIDLDPLPPATARISKKVGLVVLGLVLLVGSLVVYGLYSRKEQQATNRRASEAKHPEPARTAGEQVVRELAPPAVQNPSSPSEGLESKAAGALASEKNSIEAPSLNSGDGNRSSSESSGEGEMSAEERLRLAAFRDEQQAMAAPTVIRSSGLPSVTPSAAAIENPPYGALASSFASLLKQPTTSEASAPPSALGQTPNTYAVQNGQSQKQAFFERIHSRAADDYLKSVRAAPIGKYELKAGWEIPAALEQAISSDLPGEAKALVRSNVYDTATGRYLLIPQGARLIGTYNSEIGYGQNRLQIVWTRIVFPDGSTIDLDAMNGHDGSGKTGLHDQVDNHYPRLMGFAVLTSAFAAGIELSQRQNTSLLTTPTAGQTASAAVGQQLGELGSEVTRRNLDLQPTIRIRVGYRFNVRVNRDILFESPYRTM
jgi:type IV secretion system protein TrbI